MTLKQPQPQHLQASTPLASLQKQLSNLIETTVTQLFETNIIQSQHELQNVFISHEESSKDSFHLENLTNLINYIIAINIEQREQNESFFQELQKRTLQNDNTILQGLDVFIDITQCLYEFSREIYSDKERSLSLTVQIYKHFRQVYELTEELSGILNQYIFENQQNLKKRDELIAMQIKCMQRIFLSQEQNPPLMEKNNANIYNHSILSQQNPSRDAQEYILSLRQQINHLHQTLLKNDEEFTFEIQNYNKTIREMSNIIKTYEIQIEKISNYQMRIEELQKVIVRMREEKYKNQIVIQNMAKKIRNFEKQLRGDKAFLSPQRHKLVSSPETKFSILNSKSIGTSSVPYSISNLNINQVASPVPVKKSFF